MTTRARARGFTLVELMMVVAIIGIVSSVAMPAFKTFQLRARAAERRTVMKYIKAGIQDVYVQFGRMQDSKGTAVEFAWASPNPPLPVTPGKRPFIAGLAGWQYIAPTMSFVDGAMYYTYQWWVMDFPGAQFAFIQAQGDLDGDGRISTKQVWYQLENQVLRTHPEWGWVMPKDGQEDDQDPATRSF